MYIILDVFYQFCEFGIASLSVYKKNETQTNGYQGNIEKYLLLDSELIDYAGQFPISEGGQEQENIEKVLLTHTWKEALERSSTSRNYVQVEKGITLSGILKKANGQAAPYQPIELTYKNNDEIGYETKVTDALGQFVFEDLQFSDTTNVRLRAKSTLDYSIVLDEFSPLRKALLDSTFTVRSKDCSVHTSLFAERSPSTAEEKKLIKSDTVELQEVEVKGKRPAIRKKFDEKRFLYTSASQTLDFENLEELTNPLLALSGRVPGLTYRIGQGVFLRSPNSINGSEGALLLLDGSPVSDINAIESLSFSNIDFIDVVKGFQASIFGSAGVNGVIAIYTKNAKTNGKNIQSNSRNQLTIIHPGFASPKNFVRSR